VEIEREYSEKAPERGLFPLFIRAGSGSQRRTVLRWLLVVGFLRNMVK